MSKLHAAGLFYDQVFETTPKESKDFIAQKPVFGKAQISELFMDHTFLDTLALSGCSFDETSTDALADALAKTMSLVTLSFRNIAGVPMIDPANVLCVSLVENLSITTVDLTNSGLSAQAAKDVAERVIPWNRTVQHWSFAENELMRDQGVNALTEAFSKGSTVQRLSFRKTGVTNLAAALKHLSSLNELHQLDVTENEGFNESVKKQLMELDDKLLSNGKLLYSSEKIEENPMWKEEKPLEAPANDASPDENKPEEKPATEKSPPPKTRTRGATVKADSSPTPQRQRSGTVKRTQSMKKDSGPSPPPKEEEKKNDGEKAEPTKKPEEEKKDTAEKKDTTNNDKADKKPATASPARRKTQSPSPAPRNTTPSRARTPDRTRQDAVDDGYEEWKKTRNEYNQYIRCGSSRSNSPARKAPPEPPKFLFGKRVEQVSARASPQFVGSTHRTRERLPTPREVAKLAPWNKQDANSATSVGTRHRVQVDDGTNTNNKEPTVITFVDGGQITYLNDDPRDIGHFARKVKEGMVKPQPTMMNSNTPRECRFGVDEKDKGFVHKKAQAPGPGAYVIESEWEKNARKLREQRRSTSASGRPLFNSAAAPRKLHVPIYGADMPGPGAYEIP